MTDEKSVMKAIASDALAWTEENGLKGDLDVSVSVNEHVIKAVVNERKTQRIATCTYQRDGRRSMYELERK